MKILYTEKFSKDLDSIANDEKLTDIAPERLYDQIEVGQRELAVQAS